MFWMLYLAGQVGLASTVNATHKFAAMTPLSWSWGKGPGTADMQSRSSPSLAQIKQPHTLRHEAVLLEGQVGLDLPLAGPQLHL
jgi:hypothetical protein